MAPLHPLRAHGLAIRLAVFCLALLAPPASALVGLDAFAAPTGPSWQGPNTALLDLAGAPSPAAEHPLRPPVRAHIARVALDRAGCTPPGGACGSAERDPHEHASPLLRWRLAHSTSSGVD